jgi:hypothetical protein
MFYSLDARVADSLQTSRGTRLAGKWLEFRINPDMFTSTVASPDSHPPAFQNPEEL